MACGAQFDPPSSTVPDDQDDTEVLLEAVQPPADDARGHGQQHGSPPDTALCGYGDEALQGSKVKAFRDSSLHAFLGRFLERPWRRSK